MYEVGPEPHYKSSHCGKLTITTAAAAGWCCCSSRRGLADLLGRSVAGRSCVCRSSPSCAVGRAKGSCCRSAWAQAARAAAGNPGSSSRDVRWAAQRATVHGTRASVWALFEEIDVEFIGLWKEGIGDWYCYCSVDCCVMAEGDYFYFEGNWEFEWWFIIWLRYDSWILDFSTLQCNQLKLHAKLKSRKIQADKYKIRILSFWKVQNPYILLLKMAIPAFCRLRHFNILVVF